MRSLTTSKLSATPAPGVAGERSEARRTRNAIGKLPWKGVAEPAETAGRCRPPWDRAVRGVIAASGQVLGGGRQDLRVADQHGYFALQSTLPPQVRAVKTPVRRIPETPPVSCGRPPVGV